MVSEYARPFRGWAYIILTVLSALEITFTILRLLYTLTPRGEDRFLNNGNPFYEGMVMEMAITSGFTFLFCLIMLYMLRFERPLGPVSRNWFETLCLGILWLLWIGGAGAATTTWPDLNFCVRFSQCRILQAMMAWNWLGWIVITLVLLPALYYGHTNSVWNGQVYNGWRPEDEEAFVPQNNRRRTKATTMNVSAPIMRPDVMAMANDPFEYARQQQMVDQWLLTGPRPNEAPSILSESSVRENLREYN